MHQSLWQKIADILLLRKLQQKWRSFAAFLGIAAVFCTTYMLILPAITVSKDTFCNKQEHIHSKSCYEFVPLLICTRDHSPHEDACYAQKKTLICLKEEHVHTDACYEASKLTNGNVTSGNIVTAGNILKELSKQDRKAVEEVIALIDLLPTFEEFYEKAEELSYLEDTSKFEEYYSKIHLYTNNALAVWQGLDENLLDYVHNYSKMEVLNEFFSSRATFEVTPTTGKIKVGYINKGFSGTAAPISIITHGGPPSSVITSGSKPNQYWGALVIEYDSEINEYYVSKKYFSTTAATIQSLKATTAKGFVLFCWSGETASYNIANSVSVGKYVKVSKAPTTISSGGYNSNGHLTVEFGNYVPPTTTEPTTEPTTQPPVETEPEYTLYNIRTDDPTPGEGSDVQIKAMGGKGISGNKDVEISKSIDGTDLENVFDITLSVRTESDIEYFKENAGMDVVIVMDISNTMNKDYGTTTRYYAAVEAAENFLNSLADENFGNARVGFVAFNTHAHEIFPLSLCTDRTQSAALISTMKTKTADIARASGYATDRARFTNVEGGLKRGYDMLASSGSKNSYIIFLSDGFPTTYLKSGYTGWEPFSSSGTKGADGVFYNAIAGVYSSGGTNYSEKGAVRAREQATIIKNSGTKIFSIGVDVGGHTILNYYNGAHSTVDTMHTSINADFEIGKANDTEGYKNWLKNSIGSGYYYDSTNKTELQGAFDNIFEEIKRLYSYDIRTVWAATDPLPVVDGYLRVMDFVYFYDKNGNPSATPESLIGSLGEGTENSATHGNDTIYWDLKDSGYTKTVDGSKTYYYYTLKYRVRLKNELSAFKEVIYETNGDAELVYKTIVTVNGVQSISEEKRLFFPKPAVTGYLSEFSFTKKDNLGNQLQGAEFTLIHDLTNCSICRGDNTAVTIASQVKLSTADGSVVFEKIPSGHKYILRETKVPEGYYITQGDYNVTVGYNVIDIKDSFGADLGSTVINYSLYHVLPETGGAGTYSLYIYGGLLISLSFVFLLCYKNGKGRRRRCSEE